MSINQGRRPGHIIAISEELQQILLCTVAEVKAVTVVIVASNHYSIFRCLEEARGELVGGGQA